MEISLRDSVISSRNTSLLSALPSAALSSMLLSSGMAFHRVLHHLLHGVQQFFNLCIICTPRVLTDHPWGAKLFGKAEPEFHPAFLEGDLPEAHGQVRETVRIVIRGILCRHHEF